MITTAEVLRAPILSERSNTATRRRFCAQPSSKLTVRTSTFDESSIAAAGQDDLPGPRHRWKQ